MKKVFVQLWKWVLKYRKNIIYGALALFAVQICFFDIGGIGLDNEVFADGNTATQNADFDKIITEKEGMIRFFRSALYVLIYPLLFLAGKLVDNSFVYGEIFGFDAVLWNLWNIVRNLANYGLGFIFVYKIFEYLIKGQKAGEVKKLIISSLIADIGIQASWFVMAVLIDISTILTYSVGGLPLSVLGQTEDSDKEYNPHVLKTMVSVDADMSDMSIYMQTTNNGTRLIISQCETFSYQGTYKGGGSDTDKDIDETLILAPKMIYYRNATGDYLSTEQNVCHYYGQIYWFKGLAEELKNKWSSKCDKDCEQRQSEYKEARENLRQNLSATGSVDTLVNLINAGTILEIGDAHLTGGIYGDKSFGIILNDRDVGLDVENKKIGAGSKSLSELLDSEETEDSYVSVFTSLYSSLMFAGEKVIAAEAKGTYVQFLKGILSFGILVAIAIPLLVSVIVFLMRIGIIWIAVALSPMIVLFTAFGLLDDIIKKTNNKFLSYFKIGNLIGIIFSPAVICFAISLSTVLVNMIGKVAFTKIATEPLILGGLVEIDIAGFSIGLGQLIISFMGIAITWILVWAAVKASELGKDGGFIDNLYKLSQNALGTIPIVPVPGKNGQGVQMVGANTMFGLNGQKSILDTASQKAMDKFESKDNAAVEQLFNGGKISENKDKPSETKQSAPEFQDGEIQQYVEAINLQSGQSWTSKTISIGEGDNKRDLVFNNLSDTSKKKVIEQINTLGGDADKFGNAEGQITIGDKKYVFDSSNHKYIEQAATQTPTT